MIICCWLALVLLTIICICVYKLYLSVSRNGGGKLSDNSEIEKKKKKKVIESDFLIESTTTDGETYSYPPPSSATDTFTRIADNYAKNPLAELSVDDLTDYYITEKDLDLYVELGYLEKPSDNIYKLTKKGWEALRWNREFKKKWKRE